jgi:uncharacterized membrane protein
MSGMSDESDPRRQGGTRSHVAGPVALLALAIAMAVWFWTTRQDAQTEVSASYGVIAVGAGVFVAALIAQIRSMSLFEILELVGHLVLGLFSIIGAILKGIWNLICEVFDWN